MAISQPADTDPPSARPYSHTMTLIKNTAGHVQKFLNEPTSALHSDLWLDAKQQVMTMKTLEPTIQNKEIVVRCFADTLDKFCDILIRKMHRRTMTMSEAEEHVYNINDQTADFLRQQWECLSLGYLQNYDDDLDAALEAIINIQ